MRILLASNASYDPPRGGSTRSNLAWLRRLAARGHACAVAASSLTQEPRQSVVDGIAIHSVPSLSLHAAALGRLIREFQPDWVLVSSEDLSHTLLREAARTAPGRIVYLAHTPQFFPFGPESWHADPPAAEIVRNAAAVVAIGRHMAAYVREHLGRDAAVIHPPIYGDPPWPDLSDFSRKRVLMINPCVVKGISIFLELARHFPDIPFDALRGWGTTPEDEAELSRLPNVSLLGAVGRIEEFLGRGSILLMPSLWYEGFGLIVMEAMLRGIPVVSSDSGGLLEAKCGTGFVIPVKPPECYRMEFDAAHMPRPVLPPQDIRPWIAALRTLLEDEAEYRAESGRSRQAAAAFVASVDPDAMERFLASLPPARLPIAAAERPLDSARQALLLKLLKQRSRTS
ncbi:MAG: glycosyltransferase family 4 protein [Bryobacteraceae bacterium]|nr:glycosyltransferase family 4 protein [Bryobacteraceae bacterium]